MDEKRQITNEALDIYMKYKPEQLITSCPLCKKTFVKSNKLKVLDIAEVVNNALKANTIQPVSKHIEAEKIESV